MQTYLKLNNEAYESFMEFINQIFQHANSYGSRSSILSVLAWVLGLISAALIVCVIFKAPSLFLYFLAGCFFIVLVAILGAFFYCLLTNKTDVLRSEKFNIEKLALEMRVQGDSLTGNKLVSSNDTTQTVGNTYSEDDQA